jgi:CRP-like cAMP-binding protein
MLKEWIPAIVANRKNFLLKKGQVLFNEGDKVRGVYFVYRGELKVHKRFSLPVDDVFC